MNQIALGDDHLGWIIIHGESVSAPFISSVMFFAYSDKSILQERAEISLAGTPVQISAALSTMEATRLRSIQYNMGAYPYPQFLRFQQTSAPKYYYTPIDQISFDMNPSGYLTRESGSALITMHYQRPNYFEGEDQELTLTDISGIDHVNGLDLINHLDSGLGHSNTMLVEPGSFTTELPASVRFEIENTYPSGRAQDFLIGMYHHPNVTDHRFFFGQYSDISGGSAVADPDAIEGNYRTTTWTAANYTTLFNFAITDVNIHCLDGRWYRPVVHLFNSHSYTDLYCRLSLVRGIDVLEVGEVIYADPAFQYLVFPPVQLPPNKMLREALPLGLEIQMEGVRTSGSLATLAIDQIVLLPLDPSLSLLGIYGMDPSDMLIYDSSREIQNLRCTTEGLESVGHVIRGGPLRLYPDEYNRIIVLIANDNHQIDIERTFRLSASYRERVRFI